ncbi:MAG: zinc ribbon domain-containing protein [Parachlamydiaceae bacterium]|nr:zinc ribbon domain-containing protein [Parachlamydiaceae bacterium]
MPNYDYHCSECGHKSEIFQKITDQPIAICPSCKKSTLKRGPGGGIGLAFKGSGFYITDYNTEPKSNENKEPPSKGCSDCSCGKNP